VTGISAGALLAPFAFLGTNYDAALRDIYSDLKPSDLFRRKGLLRILRDDSIFDTTPLRGILEKHITTNFLAAVAREHAKRSPPLDRHRESRRAPPGHLGHGRRSPPATIPMRPIFSVK
jgi:hypothetical protein